MASRDPQRNGLQRPGKSPKQSPSPWFRFPPSSVVSIFVNLTPSQFHRVTFYMMFTLFMSPPSRSSSGLAVLEAGGVVRDRAGGPQVPSPGSGPCRGEVCFRWAPPRPCASARSHARAAAGGIAAKAPEEPLGHDEAPRGESDGDVSDGQHFDDGADGSRLQAGC